MREERAAGDEGLGAGGAAAEGARAELANGGPTDLTALAGAGLAQDVPAQDAPVQDAPVQDAPALDLSALDLSARASAAEDVPVANRDPLKQAAPEPAGLLPDSEVFIEIPADRLYVVLARSAAVHLGSVLQLGISDVTDLRLAVDEACALFLLHPAFPDGREVGLACRFAAYREELRVTVRAPVPAGFAPDTEAIGWIMLGALVDDLAWTRQDGYGTLTLTKRFPPPTTR
jgi:serine/threonine-protein kinase RsbW